VVLADNLFCIGCRRCVDLCPNHAIEVTGSRESMAGALKRLRQAGLGVDGPVERVTAGADVGRRRFLTGAGLLGGGLVAGATIGAATAGRTTGLTGPTGAGSSGGGSTRLGAVPFHGTHQAGILTSAPSAALFAVFDLTVTSPAELAELMKALTVIARQAAVGGALPDRGLTAPPADNALLGSDPPADGLTVTVGFGASVFDDRFGLSALAPKRLTRMPAFTGDELDPVRSHGDLLLQLRAGHSDTTLRALRLINRATGGGMRLRHRIAGFVDPPIASRAPRTLQGFAFGISNPDVRTASVADRLLWAGADEPAWAAAGSYQVVRIIRMFVEPWDRLSLPEQELAIGRRRDTGAPLDGQAEADVPRYANDPEGTVIPLTAHIRRANPRTAASDRSQFLRVGYNYDSGVDSDGNLDMGLIFTGYQQDLRRQFEAVRIRLAGEPLADYVRTTGGGYFFALPGVRDRSDHYARALFP